MRHLFLAGSSVRYPYDLPGSDIEFGLLRLPDDGGTGLNEYLLGQEFMLELHPNKWARDESLGYVNRHVEYVPVSWSEVSEYSISQFAVGPKLGDEGFDEITSLILPFLAYQMYECMYKNRQSQINFYCNKVKYIVFGTNDLSVAYYPMYDQPIDENNAVATVRWLMQKFRSFIPDCPTNGAEIDELTEALRSRLIELDAHESSI